MEKLVNKRALALAGLILVGSAALSGCSDPDYEGVENAFEVTGPITNVTSDRIDIDDKAIVVEETEGRSTVWFQKGFGRDWRTLDYRMFDRYTDPDEGGFWDLCGDDAIVGKVISITGAEIDMQDLTVGDVVEVDGRIRDSRVYSGKACTFTGRAVFDTVTVLEDN